MENKNCEHSKDVGGQAVIEGVMMRGAKSLAIAVRKPNNEIVVKSEKLNPLKEKFSPFKLPILRGLAVLIESLVLGMKALTYSANQAIETKGEEPQKEMGGFTMGITMLISIVLGAGLFIIIPERLASLLSNIALPSSWDGTSTKGFLFNLFDGIIRLIIFFLYIIIISRSKQIARVFEYHGAEHKSIHTYEAGEELTEENAMKYSPLHPRCGTAFLLTVMIISIIVFSLFGKPDSILMRIGSRLVLIPLIAGVSYEIIKLTAKRQNYAIVRLIIIPGLWLQRLTTREPSIDQVQVAIRSLKEVLAMERELNE